MSGKDHYVKAAYDLAERVKQLHQELEDERKSNRLLKLDINRLQSERDAFKKQLGIEDVTQEHHSKELKSVPSTPKTSKLVEQLKLQLANLESQYDDLLTHYNRKEARYKEDFAKWRDVKKWLFDENSDKEEWTKKGNEICRQEIDEGERTNAKIWKKREMLIQRRRELKASRDKTPAGQENKENINPIAYSNQSEKHVDAGVQSRTPLHERKRRRLNEDVVTTVNSPSDVRSRSPVILAPLSSELFAISPIPTTTTPGTIARLRRVPGATATPFTTDSSPTVFGSAVPPSDLFGPKTTPTPCPIKYSAVPPLSQSQDVNQRGTKLNAYNQPSYKREHSPVLAVMLSTEIPGSSDTEEDSQAASPVPQEQLPQEMPVFPCTVPSISQPSDGVTNIQSSSNHKSPPAQRIKRRKNDDTNGADRFEDRNRVPATQTSLLSGETSTGRGERFGQAQGVNNGQSSTTPANKVSSSSKQLTDYSAYKGRGRYAQQVASAEKTINALYAIDPSRNEGHDFQYDEVVRVKEDRRRLDAEDCECCRDYYEAVGPMPNRLQPPLWRSPSSTPKKTHHHHHHVSSLLPVSKDGEHGDAEGHREAVAAHKQAISRHRKRWGRAQTPPGYWNIGFPTTQEAQEINEQAMQMHEAKRRSIEAEVTNGNGRYTKR